MYSHTSFSKMCCPNYNHVNYLVLIKGVKKKSM